MKKNAYPLGNLKAIRVSGSTHTAHDISTRRLVAPLCSRTQNVQNAKECVLMAVVYRRCFWVTNIAGTITFAVVSEVLEYPSFVLKYRTCFCQYVLKRRLALYGLPPRLGPKVASKPLKHDTEYATKWTTFVPFVLGLLEITNVTDTVHSTLYQTGV